MNRSVQSFLAWKQERLKKQMDLKEKKLQAEIKSYSFQPKLSDRSKKIMSKKKNNVIDRNYEFELKRNQKLNAIILQELVRGNLLL